MREILFKAKRIDNNEWVEGLLTVMFGQYHIINPNDENTAYPINTDTVCQYTGMTDDKGCKIWENDVVVYSWTNGQDEAETENTKVTYDKHGFTPFIWDYECDGCCLYNQILEIEVIGNIFDNPDL